MSAYLRVFRTLLDRYGPQRWWPGETPFEVMVGAVLTQNTAWTNVEKCIANLKAAHWLEPDRLATAPLPRLAAYLRPVGYFNVKAERLRSYCQWYIERGGYSALARLDTAALRSELLDVKGVGAETADDILLYAFGRPVFVIDAYTRRLFGRLGLVRGDESYETLRAHFETSVVRELARESAFAEDPETRAVAVFNEYHALVVIHAKDICRKKPRCPQCVLSASCPAQLRTPTRT